MYYHECVTKGNVRADAILDHCDNHHCGLKRDMLTKHLTCHSKLVYNICSSEDIPLYTYHILVQGLFNNINRRFTGNVDTIL